MCKVYLDNQTGGSLWTRGANGTSWKGLSINVEIPDKATVLLGELENRSSVGDNWGWIYIGHQSNYQTTHNPPLQLYVLLGYYSGIKDYCVQYYDGGSNTSGETIPHTKAELGTGGDSVILTVGHVFDPWTSRLGDDLKLHQITIPGTHDSGTKGLAVGTECQSSTINEQLIWGIRYFDIRVDSSTSGLRIVHGDSHGSGNTNLYLKDVAEMFCDFLTGKSGFPSTQETVIMQLKSDRGSQSGMHQKVLDILNAAFAGHLDRLYLNPIRLNLGPIPTLENLRGKLVLLRRYDYSQEDASDAGTAVRAFASGLVYNNWSNNHGGQSWESVFTANEFIWPNANDNKSYFGSLIDYRNRHGLSFIIQDKYEGYGSYQDKADLVKGYLNYVSQGDSPDSWFINFASCSFPEISYKTVNPELEAYFQSHSKPGNGLSYGTIMMDFVDAKLIRDIIASNFDNP
jgi:hypothetical protein